jgi:hypothetical protein
MSVRSMTRTLVSRLCSARGRSTTNAANAITSRTLPSSEAWKEKKPTSIARREPRATEPSAETGEDRRDEQP